MIYKIILLGHLFLGSIYGLEEENYYENKFFFEDITIYDTIYEKKEIKEYMSWKRFDDVKPPVGEHLLIIGRDFLWWGFYNPEREDGQPTSPGIFWMEVPNFPTLPPVPVELLPEE